MPSILRPVLIAALAALSVPAHAAGDAANGAALYRARCSACHSLDFNGVGPAHRGVFGRHAGSAPGYAYSPALKAAGVVWDDTTLERWLSDPERFIPGQRMGVNVPDAGERADLIAYLRGAGEKPAASN